MELGKERGRKSEEERGKEKEKRKLGSVGETVVRDGAGRKDSHHSGSG